MLSNAYVSYKMILICKENFYYDEFRHYGSTFIKNTTQTLKKYRDS